MPPRALLVSTYELGRQPFGLASPAAWLRRDGIDVELVDVSKQPLSDASICAADFVGFYLPMHTATRLAGPIIEKVRARNAAARLCAYGLYAPLNAEWLRSLGVQHVLGAEFEDDLLQLVRSDSPARPPDGRALARLQFLVPDRTGLPPLGRYATLRMPDGEKKPAGYTEASRGCRHLCRHCPVVPIYNGQFRVVQRDVVASDIEAQVAAGAQHITFGDPDFFNGPTHAMRVVEALHARHPSVTYDVTIKIEHLLQHDALVPILAATGCLFVTSAVESVDDRVLALLDKGHTRRDFARAVSLCRAAGVTLVPTFVPFHPWTTLDGYCDLVDTIAALELVDQVAPIQLAIRLLIPQGSRMLELAGVQAVIRNFDATTLAFPWTHPDGRVDALHADINALVGGGLAADRRAMFVAIARLAHERAGTPCPGYAMPDTAPVPYIDEPWYCCAEPNPEQLRLV